MAKKKHLKIGFLKIKAKGGLIVKPENLAVENLKKIVKGLILHVDQQKHNVMRRQKRKQDQKELVGKMVEKKQQLAVLLQLEARELLWQTD